MNDEYLSAEDNHYRKLIEARMPPYVADVLSRLGKKGYEAYAVGGCIRDCLLSLEPKDWDVCTSALPEQIIDCFSDYRVILTGVKHGTVTVVVPSDCGVNDADESFKHVVEVTTFRIDAGYSDNRHPDNVNFVGDVREDLARRDFTVNAMAFSVERGFTDCFGGLTDLKDRVIRCVGDPGERFNEDGLRIMRAIRFSASLGFDIETRTAKAIHANLNLLKNISAERIASELDLLILSDNVKRTLEEYSDALLVFVPEIEPMIGFEQHNVNHIYDVWRHTLVGVENSPKLREIRLAMLFHDIAKPECATKSEQMGHFYGHAKRGADIAKGILTRLRYDNSAIQTVTLLILHHTDKLTIDRVHVKQMLRRFGAGTLKKLLQVKKADILGKNPKFFSAKLKEIDEYEELVNEVLLDKQCFDIRGLAINGADLIAAGVPEGKRIGDILDSLLDMVIEEKIANDRETLLANVQLLM